MSMWKFQQIEKSKYPISCVHNMGLVIGAQEERLPVRCLRVKTEYIKREINAYRKPEVSSQLLKLRIKVYELHTG